MKIYYTIRNYSKLFLHKKPFKHKMFLSIHNQKIKISSTEHTITDHEELSILNSLDNFKVQYKNQFTCLLTRCIFCNHISLYINKITGKYYKKKFKPFLWLILIL